MTASRADLDEKFSLLNDDALLELFRSGELTEAARDAAAAELRRRGCETLRLSYGIRRTTAPTVRCPKRALRYRLRAVADLSMSGGPALGSHQLRNTRCSR
jgi:hypothetical protein